MFSNGSFCIRVAMVTIIIMVVGMAHAQLAPDQLALSGILLDASGEAYSGQHVLTARIFDASSAGTLIYWESRTIDLTDTDGYFAIALGEIQPVSTVVFSESGRYLELEVDNDGPLLPRRRIVSSAYAYHADTVADDSVTTAKLADGAVTTDKLYDGAVTSQKINTVSADQLTGNLSVARMPEEGTWTLTSDLNIDELLFLDKINQRVGLQTAAPEHLLDVSGTLRAQRFLSPYRNYLVVDKTGAGDFTTITEAVDYINAQGDNAVLNPYFIQVMAGDFVEDVTLPDSVSMSGLSWTASRIRGRVTVNSHNHVSNVLIFPNDPEVIAFDANPTSAVSYLTSSYVVIDTATSGDSVLVRFRGTTDLRIYNNFLYSRNPYNGPVGSRSILVKNEAPLPGSGADVELQQNHLKISAPHNTRAVLALNATTRNGSDIIITGSDWSVFNDDHPIAAINENPNGNIKLSIAYENNSKDYNQFLIEGPRVILSPAMHANIVSMLGSGFQSGTAFTVQYSGDVSLNGPLSGIDVDLVTHVLAEDHPVTGMSVSVPDSGSGTSSGIIISGSPDYGLRVEGAEENYLMGRVGINTSTPASTLSVDGDIALSGGLLLQSPSSSAEVTVDSSTDNLRFLFDDTLQFRFASDGNGYANQWNTGGADLAEYYRMDPHIQPGEIVVSQAFENQIEVTLADQAYHADLFGVVSTRPGVQLRTPDESESEHYQPVALLGLAPVIVSTLGGDIAPNDRITSSAFHGIGQKAHEPGMVIGRTLQSLDQQSAIEVDSLATIVWPPDPLGDNSARPCFRLPDGVYVGKVMVFINVSWYQPTTDNQTDLLQSLVTELDQLRARVQQLEQGQ